MNNIKIVSKTAEALRYERREVPRGGGGGAPVTVDWRSRPIGEMYKTHNPPTSPSGYGVVNGSGPVDPRSGCRTCSDLPDKGESRGVEVEFYWLRAGSIGLSGLEFSLGKGLGTLFWLCVCVCVCVCVCGPEGHGSMARMCRVAVEEALDG